MLFGTRRSLLSSAQGIVYLLLDRFATDAAAPLASPRTAEPGPGTLTLVQTDGQFSIVSSALNFPVQGTPAAYEDQYLRGPAMARLSGRVLLATVNYSTPSFNALGWTPNSGLVNPSSQLEASVYSDGTNIGTRTKTPGPTGGISAAAVSAATNYQLATILRSSGSFTLVKGGVLAEWTLLWVDPFNNSATLYPVFTNFSAAGTLDNFRVTDLPAPWNTDYGIATQRLAGSVAAGTPFVHEADCLIEYTVTTLPSAGNIFTYFRLQDANNYWRIVISSTGGIWLDEVVAGAATTRGTVAGVVANGDRMVIVAAGTTIRVYEANTLRITYASATNFQTETDGSLATLGTGGVVSDLISYPRTLSGAALSTLSAV